MKTDSSRAVSACQCYFYSLVHYFSVLLAQPTQTGLRLVATFDFGSLGHVPKLRFQSSILLRDQDSEPETSQTITQISLEFCKGFGHSKVVLNF